MLPLVCVPSGRHDRRQLRQVLDVSHVAALVAVLVGGHAQRHDLVQEAPLAHGLLGLQVREQCIGILPVPADAEPPGQVLRRRHRVGRVGGIPVLRLQADEPRRLEQALGARHPPRRRRQRFAPAGDHDPGLAQRHGAHAEQDRIEAGRALAVHGERGHAVAKAGGKADDAGRVAPRRGIAEDDLIDRAGLEPGRPGAPPAPRARPGSRCAGSCAGRRAGRARYAARQRCMQVPAPWPRSWGTHPHLSTIRRKAPRPACRRVSLRSRDTTRTWRNAARCR